MLSSRPEVWIDNMAISRVEIGDTRRRTIGAAKDAVDMRALVAQLRDSLKDEIKPVEPQRAKTTSLLGIPVLVNSPSWLRPALVLAILLVFTGQQYWLFELRDQSQKSENIDVADNKVTDAPHQGEPTSFRVKPEAEVSPPVVQPSLKVVEVNQEFIQPTPLPPTQVPTAPPAVLAPFRGAMVLSRYPVPLQNSILDAFNGKDLPVGGLSQLAERKSVLVVGKDQGEKPSTDLLKLLENAGGEEGPAKSGDRPSYPSTQQQVDEPASRPEVIDENVDWEKRREEMRQRFLQAISEANQGGE